MAFGIKKRGVSWCLVMVGALCLLSAGWSLAVEKAEGTKVMAVGKIEKLAGRAKANLPGQAPRNLADGSEVFMGDTIRTGRGSNIKIRFNDATTIVLGQKAKLVINKFVYKAGDKSSVCVSTLETGTFKLIGGAISKLAPDQTKVHTPTATIGIRGTECVGVASAKSLTAIYTEGNAISVTNDKGQTILTGEFGMGCETLLGEKPGKARKYSLSEINRITSRVSRVMVRMSVQNAVRAGTRNVGARTPSH